MFCGGQKIPIIYIILAEDGPFVCRLKKNPYLCNEKPKFTHHEKDVFLSIDSVLCYGK